MIQLSLTCVVLSVFLLAPPAAMQQPPSTVGPAGGAPAGLPQASPPAAAEEPKPELERPTVWGEPTEVTVSIFVIDVDEVDSAEQSFAASVYYQARWRSPLLAHPGPGPMFRSVTDVWTPMLVIVNQQMAWSAFPGAVEIDPSGEVIYRQKVWGRFSQPLDLHDFPLDRQTLSIHIVAAGVTQEDVKIVALERDGKSASGIADQFSLPDFDVVSWKAEPAVYAPTHDSRSAAGFQMRLDVRRHVTYYVTKVIVPLCLIVIMSWVPRWIDPKQIGTNIGISTTSFLTLVAYLFAINVLLPRVSYITRMDRFILLSTVVVFASLLHTVVGTALIERGKLSAVRRVDRWSRVVYPAALAVILVVSFVL